MISNLNDKKTHTKEMISNLNDIKNHHIRKISRMFEQTTMRQTSVASTIFPSSEILGAISVFTK